MPSERPFIELFGSWGSAIRAAGYEPQKSFPSPQCLKAVSISHKGKQSFHWKGGRIINKFGYVEIWCPNHPNANKSGYIREHRLIMSNYLNRPLTIDEDVHHINEIKADNRLENLELILKSNHTSLHHKNIPKSKHNALPCKICGELTKSKYQLCKPHYKQQWYFQKKNNKNQYLLQQTEVNNEL